MCINCLGVQNHELIDLIELPVLVCRATILSIQLRHDNRSHLLCSKVQGMYMRLRNLEWVPAGVYRGPAWLPVCYLRSMAKALPRFIAGIQRVRQTLTSSLGC